MSANRNIFHINPSYRKATIWHSNDSGERMGVSTTTPDKGLSRGGRYTVIAEWLRGHNIKPPQYSDKETPNFRHKK